MKPKVSLRAVAEAAGVSLGTASQALRNEGDTARETCERVRDIARKLGYCPNPVIASLASRQFRSPGKLGNAGIAFVANPPDDWAYKHEKFLAACQTSARQSGFRFESRFVHGQDELGRVSSELYHRGFLGVAFGLFLHQEWLEPSLWQDFSMVWCGGRFSRIMVDTVKVDVARTVSMAVEKALALGFKKIGMVSVRHSREHIFDDDLRDAMMQFLHGRHAEAQAVPILKTTFEDATSRAEAVKWYHAHKPDVVIAMPAVRFWLEAGSAAFRKSPSMIQLNVEVSERKFEGMGFWESEEEIAGVAIERLGWMIRHGIKGFPEKPVMLNLSPRWAGSDR